MPPLTKTEELAAQFWEIIPLVMRVAAADLRRSGKAINPAYFRLLGMLAKSPHTLGELAERQAVSQATMSNTVTTLEQRGWVARQRSREDRRQVLVEITPQGKSLQERIRVQMVTRIADALEPLSQDQRTTLAEGLDILHDIFRATLVQDYDPACGQET